MGLSKDFLLKRLRDVIALCSLLFALCFAQPAHADENIVTPLVRDAFVGNLTADIDAITPPSQLVSDYIPVEARVGRAMIGGLSYVAGVLDNSLVRFVSIFIVIMFALWIMLEAYKTIDEGRGGIQKLGVDIVKKGIVIAIWIIIMEQGIVQLFVWLVGPTLSIGTYLSDLILNSVASATNISLPDTCGAIREYIMATPAGTGLIDSARTADLLCLPTRMSGFFTTAVAAGFTWMKIGIGTSAFTFITGLTFVVMFVYAGWKFALMAMSAIMGMFLGIIMLPFTAIAETTDNTTYKGIFGDIFNQFIGLFKPQKLETCVSRFISSIIYFVSLSIVVAVCAALLGGIVDMDMARNVPTLDNMGFLTTLITGCLVIYIATRADKIAKSFGGDIEQGLPEIESDIKNLWNDAKGIGKNIGKAFKSNS